MATELKRMTFMVTPDMEQLLDKMKQELFYNCSQSEMIRTLVEAGLDVLKGKGEDSISEKDKSA